jgi:anti-anti-sigma factor
MTAPTPPRFFIERHQTGEHVRLVLHGELDLANADKLTAAAEHVPSGGSLTLDLDDLGFTDSSGLRVMMNLDLRSRREGWTLSIRNPSEQVLRLLQVCGVDQRLPITSRSR